MKKTNFVAAATRLCKKDVINVLIIAVQLTCHGDCANFRRPVIAIRASNDNNWPQICTVTMTLYLMNMQRDHC